jgi:hypothetical protein
MQFQRERAGLQAVPRRMRQCLRQQQRPSGVQRRKMCRRLFILRSMPRTLAIRNRTADRSRRTFAIPILLVRAARKSTFPFAAGRKFSLSHSQSPIAQFIIKKIGARDLIFSRKSAAEVVPAAQWFWNFHYRSFKN